MAQITLYLDDNLLARMRETAAASRVSQSQFVTNLIREALHEQWPQDVVLMAGALPGFPMVEALRVALPLCFGAASASTAPASGPEGCIWDESALVARG